MSTLNVTRNYADGEVLTQADLDAFLDDIETFVNITKLNDDNLQNNGITGSLKLLTGSVTAGKLATDSVTTIKIVDQSVTTAKIADDSITTVKILDANVTEPKLAADSVTTAKIVDASVTADKIADDAVTTDKILNNAVTGAKVSSDNSVDANRAIDTNHIRDAAITRPKLGNYLSVGNISTDSNWTTGNIKTITNLAVNGRPVKVTIYGGIVQNDGTGNVTIDLQYSANNSSWVTQRAAIIKLISGGASGHSVNFNAGYFDATAATPTQAGAGTVMYVHSPTAGTAYYRFILTTTGTSVANITDNLLVLVEEM